MKQRVIVLGCGLVGATMARDLAADDSLDVAVADVSEKNLSRIAKTKNLRVRQADLGTPDKLRRLVQDFDLVVGSMPSTLGYMVLQTVIQAGKPFADISFMAEDALELDGLAQQRGVTAVVDCGVAPGLANMIIGHCAARLDAVDNVVYYVGGLPKQPKWMYQYKAPFAPADVLEEYTRPARMIENGRVVSKPALSEPEILEFPNAGQLEAFNTDGLRSLLRTIQADNMKEKTLRYPGHIQLMRILRETGFFRKDEIDVRGVKVRPLDVTSKLLFPLWELDPGEPEFTVLRVIVEGRCQSPDRKRVLSRADARATPSTPERPDVESSVRASMTASSPPGTSQIRFTYDLYDEYDAATGQSSMARTTAFPCAIVARMLARGEITEKGVLPPELLGRQPGMLEKVTKELAARGVNLISRTGPRL